MEDEDCPICLQTLDKKKDCSVTKCGHEFHCSCLVKAALKNSKCPICREDLFKTEDDGHLNVEEHFAIEDRTGIYIFEHPNLGYRNVFALYTSMVERREEIVVEEGSLSDYDSLPDLVPLTTEDLLTSPEVIPDISDDEDI